MFKKSKSDSKSYGIIGLGRFGSALAVELAKAGAEPLVIDGNEEKVREMREYTENAFVVSSFDKKTLSETGIQNCDVVVVCIGEKMDISILTTLNVVALGVPTVISKAASAEQGEILKKLGAEVVYPERDMAVRLAHRLEAPNMLDFVQLSKKLNLLKLEVPQKVIGMTIMSADLRGKFGVNIVAIENDGNMTDSVRPDYMFQKGDILYAVGNEKGINKPTGTVFTVPVFYAVLCVGRILSLSANLFLRFCLLFCILLCGSYGSDKLSSNYSSVFGISYRSRQQAYRLNMFIIVQTHPTLIHKIC